MMPTERAVGAATLFVVLAACNEQPTAPDPPDLVIIQAPSTVGAPGWALIDTLVVRAVDPSGTPRAGVAVTWVVREGGGSIAPTADETDADGYAKAVWTLGPRTGVNKVRASTVLDASADFESTGQAFQVDRLVADDNFACGLVSADLWCWGVAFWANSSPSSVRPDGGRSFAPGLLDGTHGFVDVAVSGGFGLSGGSVCGLDVQGATWCATESEPSLAKVTGLPPMRQVVGAVLGFTYGAGESFCGLTASDSTAWCWKIGATPYQLAGSPSFVSIWMSKGKLNGVAQFPYNGYRTCGLLVDSTAACWGVGAPGNGSFADGNSAVITVSGGYRFVELSVGDRYTCGRTRGEEVWCWGSTLTSQALVPVLAAVGARRVIGFSDYAQMLASLGVMTRWFGPSGAALPPPTGAAGLPVSDFAFNSALCFRMADREVYCGELNSSTADLAYYPVQPVRRLP
jgi:hypothetical protein